jgi:hypothetical protein
MLGDRKDPTWYDFLRYSDIGPTIEEQLMYYIEINKTYCNNTNAQRISILMAHDKNLSPLFVIPYEILFHCESNNMKKCTSQNKKTTTQTSAGAIGIQIRGLKFVLKNDCSTFLCFSAIMLCETKILGKSPAVKKRWCLIEFNDKFNIFYFGYFNLVTMTNSGAMLQEVLRQERWWLLLIIAGNSLVGFFFMTIHFVALWGCSTTTSNYLRLTLKATLLKAMCLCWMPSTEYRLGTMR